MSEQKSTRPKVPDGKSRYLVTRQKEANEKGYVGYDTIWEPFQKEVKYETPKRPWFDSVSKVSILRKPSRIYFLDGFFCLAR